MIPSQIPQYLLVVFVLRFLPGAHWSLKHACFACFTVSLRLDQPLSLHKNRPTHADCQAVHVHYQPDIRLLEVVEIKCFVKWPIFSSSSSNHFFELIFLRAERLNVNFARYSTESGMFY